MHATEFLWQTYAPHAWWYETADCYRRLALCGGINVMYDNTSTQGVFITGSLTLLAMFLNLRLRPFADAWNGDLSNLAALVIAWNMICVLAIRTDRCLGTGNSPRRR